MFTAVSSDIFREVPDRVQIDTTQKRQKTTENQNAMGRQPSLSRTDATENTGSRPRSRKAARPTGSRCTSGCAAPPSAASTRAGFPVHPNKPPRAAVREHARMAHVDDLIEPRLEQIALACLPPLPWLHPSPQIRCRLSTMMRANFARKSAGDALNPAKPRRGNGKKVTLYQ